MKDTIENLRGSQGKMILPSTEPGTRSMDVVDIEK
jgi:hypothetical protein